MVVEIVKEVENGIKILGLCHMDGRKKETKKEVKRIKDLRNKYNIKINKMF